MVSSIENAAKRTLKLAQCARDLDFLLQLTRSASVCVRASVYVCVCLVESGCTHGSIENQDWQKLCCSITIKMEMLHSN